MVHYFSVTLYVEHDCVQYGNVIHINPLKTENNEVYIYIFSSYRAVDTSRLDYGNVT
jgi:hypothetical protein